MEKQICTLLMLLFFSLGAIAKSNKMPQYDITGAGSGTEGTILVKVYVYAKNASDEFREFIRAGDCRGRFFGRRCGDRFLRAVGGGF